jgi:hypothetical protein
MKNTILTFILSQFLGTTLAHGATINVGAGQSIQTAIDNATAGDVLNLTAPIAYNGDFNITKPLRIVSSLNTNQSINGNLGIQNIPAGQKVTLKNISIGGTVDINNSSVNLLKCTLNSVIAKDSSLNVLKSSLSASLNATNPSGGDTLFTFVQSSIIGKLTSKTSRSWIGYSNLRQSSFEGIVEIVGNDFDGNGLGGIGIDLNGNQSVANIHNNLIHDFSGSSSANISNRYIGIRVRGNAKAEIRNNSIKNNKDTKYHGEETYVGIGIYVENTALTTISSNLITYNYVDRGNDDGSNFVQFGNAQVYAPKTNVVMRHNALDRNHLNYPELVKGGVEHYDTVSNTSEGGGFLSNTVAKMDGRAGQNSGSPDDYHKDHDGSRNDIGANGGRNYIPDGRTTNKPIPIFFSLAPQAVPIGGTVTIESTGATVK